jgi:cytochrome c-type biogenesis protein
VNASLSLSFLFAFVAGVLSFISPCILPLIPAYITYVAGISLKEAQAGKSVRKTTLLHSLFFILGFSIVFILLGASATLLGSFLLDYRDLVRQVGGIIVIFFGIYITGIIRIPFLEVEHKFTIKHKPAGLIGSLLVGMAFAAGWTPCIGPILASILLLASTTQGAFSGMVLLAFYSLGLGIPFLLTSLAINTFLHYFDRIKKYLRMVSIVSGIFLIILGVLLFTDYLHVLNIFQ